MFASIKYVMKNGEICFRALEKVSGIFPHLGKHNAVPIPWSWRIIPGDIHPVNPSDLEPRIDQRGLPAIERF
jgi:hypothetical protein